MFPLDTLILAATMVVVVPVKGGGPMEGEWQLWRSIRCRSTGRGARRQGKKLGRRPSTCLHKRFDALPDGTSVRKAAETLSCSTATIQKLRAERRTLHST